MYGITVMPPFTDSIRTPTPETAQIEAADAVLLTSPASTPSLMPDAQSPMPSACSPPHPSTLSPSQLLPPETFARFVISALTTLEELSRTSPPDATERRRAATTLLRYLLGPGPRAPRDRTSPHGGGVAASATEGATRSSSPSPAPEIPRAPRASSSATGVSAVLGGDTRASPPSLPPETPRAPRAANVPLTTSPPEGGAEGTCKVPSASGFLESPHPEDAAQGTCNVPPATPLMPDARCLMPTPPLTAIEPIDSG